MKTILNPNTVAKIIARTVPITEKNPFIPHAKAMNFLFSSSISESPSGKGIPMKKPSGAITRIEIKILNHKSHLDPASKIIGFKNPIKTDIKKTNPKIKYKLILLFDTNLCENILPNPEATSIVETTVRSVNTGCPRNIVNFCIMQI